MNLHEEYYFQAACPLSYVIFLLFFVYSLPFIYSNIMQKKLSFDPENGGGGSSLLATNPKLYCILTLHNVVTQLAAFIIRTQTTNVFVLPQLVPMQEKQKWHYQTGFFMCCKGNAINFKSKKYDQKHSLGKQVEVLNQHRLKIYKMSANSG